MTGLELSSGASLPAEVVILCMGPWTGRGLQLSGLDQSLISGHRAHSITMRLTDPATSAIDNTALFLSSLKEPEVYPRPDGTVYMCGGCSSDHVPLPSNPAEVKVDLEACRQIKTLAGHISEELKEVESYQSSACYLPYSKDGCPMIGKISKVGGLYVGAGHSCWGILQGPATGEALAQLVLTDNTDIDISRFSPERFAL